MPVRTQNARNPIDVQCAKRPLGRIDQQHLEEVSACRKMSREGQGDLLRSAARELVTTTTVRALIGFDCFISFCDQGADEILPFLRYCSDLSFLATVVASAAIAFRASVSLIIVSMADASAGTSPGGTNNPFLPCVINSAGP